ncbi:MAG: PilT/PilU family type 4a pilus ATPase [Acidobacteriota bacterium]
MKSPEDGASEGGLVDRDLEDLVRELNAESPRRTPEAPASDVRLDRLFEGRGSAEQTPLRGALELMAERGASDLHLLVGLPWALRIDDEMTPLDDRDALTAGELRHLLAPHLGAREEQLLEEHGAADFSLTAALPTGRERFRVNVHRQRGELAAAIRRLPARVPGLGALGLPESMARLIEPRQGLLLVAGPTGSGKTTTLASLVGVLNARRRAHVITIEDPVEYEHASASCFIEHVEVGRDSPSFADALRASLRQDPDVLVVGEMRDLETIEVALTAAETGHLILSSVHAADGVQALRRLVDVFPGTTRSHVAHQLALSLNAVVSQRLLPRADGRGRVVAVETLMATPAVRRQVRDGLFEKIHNEVTLGARYGMVSMESSLAALVRTGAIHESDALARSTRPDELRSLLR